MVIKKKYEKLSLKFIETIFVLEVFVGRDFVRTVFVTSIISSYTITKSPLKIYKYLPLLQAHVLGFQIQIF